MAEATTPGKHGERDEPQGARLAQSGDAERKDAASKDGSKPGGQPPHVLLRVLIGLAGIALLVGFFLPWITEAGAAEGARPVAYAGYDLALGQPWDTPGKEVLWALPALGVLLAVTGFMGFRWAGQVAIGVAVAILGYALYVLLQMFVQHTALGLWIVAGGTFIVLLLGVIAWMVESRRKAALASPKLRDDKAATARGD